MAVLDILHEPHPILRQQALPVDFERSTPDYVGRLLDDMAETMYAARGMGLAAPQVGVSLRIFVVDDAQDDEPSRLLEFVNPTIFARVREPEAGSEGCLSIPGRRVDVKRHRHIGVRALDRKGQPFELWADGILAVAIQHENDHLDGVLMVDHMSPMQRLLARKKRR